jgi:hypothetical protein
MTTRSNSADRFKKYVLGSLLAAMALSAGAFRLAHKRPHATEQATKERIAGASRADALAAVSPSSTGQPRAPAQTPAQTELQKDPVAKTEPHHALQAPVIETPDVIAGMDLGFVRDEVKRMDQELEKRNAIERLNNAEVGDEERLELGAMFQRVALFRHRLMEVDVESLTAEVAKYEKLHAERVAQFTKDLERR